MQQLQWPCTTKTYLSAGEFLGGHWALYPPSPADYFVRCLCGCAELHTVSNFEKHGGEEKVLCCHSRCPAGTMEISMQCCNNPELQLFRLYCSLRLSAEIAGRGARKKWRESIRVQEGGSKTHLGTWIEERCNAADAGSDLLS